ncbi:MAG: tryptophan--tRNA ligase, partial [Bryobacterales bacterium]|nr:tryptophan--tRNA ligase [Bryobacterales bacterium]
TFTMPATKLPSVGARIMGLDDPAKKMSKSVPVAGHAVWLLDDLKVAHKKIMRATTDSNPAVDFETMGDGVANLLAIYQAFTETTDEQVKAEFTGMRYGDLKKRVAEAVVAGLEPIQQRYREITSDPATMERLLDEGADRVRPIAEATVRLAKERMGLYLHGS